MSRRAIRHFSVTAGPDDAGHRADVVIARHTPGLSRKVARRVALAGGLRVDGHPSPPSTNVVVGMRLELRIVDSDTPRPSTLSVLRVTEHVVYVDKPAGMHTVAHSLAEPNCLATLVARRYPECADASSDPCESGALHRLDSETSGVVAFARNRNTWVRGRAAFAGGAARKRYLALCENASAWPPTVPANRSEWLRLAEPFTPPQATLAPWPRVVADACCVCAPLGAGTSRASVAVRRDGLAAKTVVLPLTSRERPYVVCAIDLETGRRHQARVHLAWIGMPIAGDSRYGSSSGFPRMMLHAVSLDLSTALPSEDEVSTTSHIGIFGPFVST